MMSRSNSRSSVAQTGKESAGKVAIVTVTYHSDRFIHEYLNSLKAQTFQAARIILIDSSPESPEPLKSIISQYDLPIELKWAGDVGFCGGCNVGWRMVRDLPYVVFLNPDAFLAPDFLENATAYMKEHANVGLLMPSLVRYDIEAHRPLDMIDTTGVVRNWFGNIVERDSGLPVKALDKYRVPNEIPWACAAAILARREALEEVIEHGDQLFDESFFMYKDDTDLSWRIRRAGWSIVHHPKLRGYHCRGWKERSAFSRKVRLLSARNEIRTSAKNRSPFVLLSLAKYAAVRFMDM